MVSAVLLCIALLLLRPGVRTGRLAFRPVWAPLPRSLLTGFAGPLLGAGLVAVFVVVTSTTLVAVLAGVCTFFAARTEQGRRRQALEERRLQGLVETLAAVGADLRSGRSVAAAAGTAVRSCPDEPSAQAVLRALRVPDVSTGPSPGGPFGEAVRCLASGVRLSGRTGCSLAAIIGAVEDDVRARLHLTRELRTAIAGPRASAALLAALPLLGLAMGSGIGADPWHVLTATGTGQVLLVVGVGLEAAGLAWSARLVRGALR